MSKLEEIVPPLEMCKQIPAGVFEDSALVYGKMIPAFVCRSDGSDPTANRGAGIWTVSPRRPKRSEECRRNNGGEFVPAPTLAEIMAELPFTDGSKRAPVCCGRWVDDLSMWVVGYRNIKGLREADRNNPAAAALRMWLGMREPKERKEV